jgi:hypothetical protein
MQIVVERKTVLAHGGVERFFSGMAEGWMTDVVDKGQGFNQVAIKSELGPDGARNLRDLDGVRQPIAKVVGVAAGKDLRLGFQSPKGARMDNAVAIPLKVVTVRMGRLGVAASAGIFYVDGVGGESGVGRQQRVPDVSLPLASTVSETATTTRAEAQFIL